MQSETLKPEDCDYTNAQELLTMLRDPIHEGAEAEIAAQFLRIHREPAPPADSAGLVAKLRLPWFTNGCEAYQLEAAHHIAAQDAEIARLREALRWALPLAEQAMEDHRLMRWQCGHKDIVGTYKNGTAYVGIYQSEVDQIEQARAALNPETGHD